MFSWQLYLTFAVRMRVPSVQTLSNLCPQILAGDAGTDPMVLSEDHQHEEREHAEGVLRRVRAGALDIRADDDDLRAQVARDCTRHRPRDVACSRETSL